jgi:hypothetical protein
MTRAGLVVVPWQSNDTLRVCEARPTLANDLQTPPGIGTLRLRCTDTCIHYTRRVVAKHFSGPPLVP